MKRFIYSLLFCTLTACGNKAAEEQVTHHHTIFTFGTLLEITLVDTTTALAEEAFNTLEADYADYHVRWSPWSEGEIASINQAFTEGDDHRISPLTSELVKEAITLSERSAGLFDPTIGLLINAWEFHRHEDPDIRPPPSKEIERLVRLSPRPGDITIDDGKIRSSNPNVQLSLGAIAKGFALERSFQRLKELDIQNAMINAGGDLKVSGSSSGTPWRIGIRHPRETSIIAAIDLDEDESIFTSGDYERVYEHAGERYHHILSPVTGYPTRGFSSVTVIHRDATVADAAATAILVAGPERWQEIARSMGVIQVMVITEGMTISMSPEMSARIELPESTKYDIVPIEPL